jgi:signal transduction histidine kinase
MWKNSKLRLTISNNLTHNIQSSFDKKVQDFDKFIKMGRVSAKLLLGLIEDILDLAKFDAGTFKLNNKSFKVHQLVEEIDYIFANQ